MKKFILSFFALFTALLVCIVLASCRNGGNGENNSENSSQKDTEKPTDEVSSGEGTSVGEETSSEGETEEETEDLTPKLSGENAKTIEYAQRIAGGINVGYSSSNRSEYAVKNRSAVFNYNLTARDQKYVSSIENTKGGVYLENTMDAFVKTNGGKVIYASDTLSRARVNVYRLGYYYYDVHILDQDFSTISGISDSVTDINIQNVSGNQVSRPSKNSDGTVSFTVVNSGDPYIVLSRARFSAEEYNAVEITLKTESAPGAELYVAVDGKGFNPSQIVGFSLEPGDDYVTYIVPLSQVTNDTGKVTSLRLDLVGSTTGETVVIKSIRALNVSYNKVDLSLDRNIHAYSDKMNQVLHFVATGKVDNMTSYGMVTKISAETVEKMTVKDAGGEHASIDGVDWNSAEYVGFDIKDVGVFGYILLPDESSGKLTVTLEDGYYVITQEYTVQTGTVFEKDANIYMGHRLYTDRNHTFDEFLNEAYCERHPLEEISITSESDGSAVLGYNVFRGAYGFKLNGTGFNQAYDNPDMQFKVNASIRGDDRERKIYVYSSTSSGALECAALLDGNGLMLPVKLEVCKNFQGEHEEPLYDKGDTSYGETIFPMVIEADSENKFTVVNMYQNWGKYPLKQLSSIQFIAPYFHLSTGVTETNCIAPYYVYGKDLWTLPDFRSMSAPLWADQPQHTSGGRLYFLQYTAADGKKYATDSTANITDTAGPTYSDIFMDYISDDGNIKVTYRHVEMPQTDENRTYYEIRLEVLNDIEINNFKDNFSLFSFDGRVVTYNKLGYLNENNECVVVDANKSSNPNYITLGKNAPYFDYYLSGAADYVNFGLIIKNSDIKVGGEKYDGNFIVKDVILSGLNYGSLTLDLDSITLKKGDYISIDMILMPWGSQNSTDDSNVRNVREDSCLNPYTVSAQVGTVIEDTFVPKVKSNGSTAEFTLSGGANNAAVRIYGFDKIAVPDIYEKVNGEWVKYDVASVNEYDGYTVHYDGDGTFSYSFIINMDGAGSRTFKVDVK